jgi:hypothetical protein
MAAFTVGCLGTNGLSVVEDVLEHVRQNGLQYTVPPIITGSADRGPFLVTFSVPGAAADVPVANMAGQLRITAGVQSVVVV